MAGNDTFRSRYSKCFTPEFSAPASPNPCGSAANLQAPPSLPSICLTLFVIFSLLVFPPVLSSIYPIQRRPHSTYIQPIAYRGSSNRVWCRVSSSTVAPRIILLPNKTGHLSDLARRGSCFADIGIPTTCQRAGRSKLLFVFVFLGSYSSHCYQLLPNFNCAALTACSIIISGKPVSSLETGLG